MRAPSMPTRSRERELACCSSPRPPYHWTKANNNSQNHFKTLLSFASTEPSRQRTWWEKPKSVKETLHREEIWGNECLIIMHFKVCLAQTSRWLFSQYSFNPLAIIPQSSVLGEKTAGTNTDSKSALKETFKAHLEFAFFPGFKSCCAATNKYVYYKFKTILLCFHY